MSLLISNIKIYLHAILYNGTNFKTEYKMVEYQIKITILWNVSTSPIIQRMLSTK